MNYLGMKLAVIALVSLSSCDSPDVSVHNSTSASANATENAATSTHWTETEENSYKEMSNYDACNPVRRRRMLYLSCRDVQSFMIWQDRYEADGSNPKIVSVSTAFTQSGLQSGYLVLTEKPLATAGKKADAN